jgi:hypothetical protein
LQECWQLLRRDLGELEIFGENLYALHSIEYRALERHFFVFAIREGEQWLSWEEVCFYAAMVDLPTVPVLEGPSGEEQEAFEAAVEEMAASPSAFESHDAYTGEPCTMEGIVTRNAAGFPVDAFRENIFKYVRANHVQTDEHWTRKWRRAKLKWEKPAG